MSHTPLRCFRPALCAAIGAALATATPLAAQEWDTARRSYTFFGRQLAIEVTADGTGALQVIRGEPGHIEVAAHAPTGLTAFALGGYRGDRLRLNALGATEANYIVVVPERVHVSVTLPGQPFPHRISDDAVLRWGQRPGGTGGVPGETAGMAGETGGVPGGTPWSAVEAPVTPAATVLVPDPDGLFLVHHAEAAPPELLLDDALLSRLRVRMEGERFEVRASEPLVLHPGAAAPLRLRTGEAPIALTVVVPAATRFFRLRSGAEVLLAVEERQASTRCDRAVSVRTAGGAQQFEFVPEAGRVRCQSP